MTHDAPPFGQLLRRYRKAAGLSREALISAFTISALERGANQSPRKDTLALLAEALGLSQAERAAPRGRRAGAGRGRTLLLRTYATDKASE